MDAAGGNKRLLAGSLPDSPSGLTWATDNSGVYYLQPAVRGDQPRLRGRSTGKSEGISRKAPMSSPDSPSPATARRRRPSPSFTKPGFLVTFNLLNPTAMKTLVDVNEDVLTGLNLGQSRGTSIQGSGRTGSPGMAHQAGRVRTRQEIPDGPLDPRRSLVHVFRRLQLGLAVVRGLRLRRLLHEPEGQHGLRPGFRQRHPVFLSGERLRRPDGRRGCRPGRRVSSTRTTSLSAAAAAEACSRPGSSATPTDSGPPSR